MNDKQTPDERWFEVLTGRAEAENRDEHLAAELRERVLDDAKDTEFELSDLDLQRGKNNLRAALRPQKSANRTPFVAGMAAGLFAAAFGLTILKTQFGTDFQEKGLPDLLTPSIELTLEGSVPVSGLYTLAETLAAADIEHSLLRDGDTVVLTFKTPAPVPDSVAAELAAIGVPADAATRYTLTR